MPRRKKDAIIPLPHEFEKKEPDASLTKVEIALEKVKQSKQSKQKPKTIIIEEQSDEDDDVEYIIQPLQQSQSTVQQQPQSTVQQQPIEKPKQKRTYTRKPKPAIPIQQSQSQPQPQQPTHNDDILKQLDFLRKENENLKTQNSLSNLSRLSTMARTMKIQF